MLSALAGVVLALGAASDIRSRVIPNAVPLALAVLGLVALASGAQPVVSLAIALGLFVLAFGAFAWGAMGGGDVKLLAAVGLWIPPAALSDFFTITALTGVVLAMAVIARRRVLAVIDGAAVAEAASVPYGAAIAAGAGYVLFAPI